MTSSKTLPAAYAARMQALLGADYAAYCNSLAQPAVTALRVNTTKIDVAHFLKIFDRALERISWTTDGFYCQDDSALGLHPYYHAGLFYIQEASAMAPVATMHPAADDSVLDLCAAPGGKSTQIAAKLSADGLIVVNDISASRLRAAVHHIERLGIKQAFVMAETVDRLIDSGVANFSKILVDAPCSGEGMFRKDPKLIDHWRADSAAHYAAIQGDLIKKAFALLARGGELTYSTCTFNALENEAVIADLLKAQPTAQLVAIDDERFSAAIACDDLPATAQCARLYPHRLRGEGHFIGRIKRLDGAVEGVATTDLNEPPDALKRFMAAVLREPLTGHFKMIGDQVYLLPRRALNTAGLRVLRSGWLLGKIKGARFDPAHSFALGLTIEQIKQPLKLTLHDSAVIKYLKCESIAVDASLTGWQVVTVDGFPLGWGKAQRGILKNKYPAHLRLMRTGQ